MNYSTLLGPFPDPPGWTTITDTRPLPEPFEPSIPCAYRTHHRGLNKVARRKNRKGVLDQVIYRAAMSNGRPMTTIVGSLIGHNAFRRMI